MQPVSEVVGQIEEKVATDKAAQDALRKAAEQTKASAAQGKAQVHKVADDAVSGGASASAKVSDAGASAASKIAHSASAAVAIVPKPTAGVDPTPTPVKTNQPPASSDVSAAAAAGSGANGRPTSGRVCCAERAKLAGTGALIVVLLFSVFKCILSGEEAEDEKEEETKESVSNGGIVERFMRHSTGGL